MMVAASADADPACTVRLHGRPPSLMAWSAASTGRHAEEPEGVCEHPDRGWRQRARRDWCAPPQESVQARQQPRHEERLLSCCSAMTSTCHDAGVEHLLRDVKDASVGTLATEVGHMNAGLQGLLSRLRQVVIMLLHVPRARSSIASEVGCAGIVRILAMGSRHTLLAICMIHRQCSMMCARYSSTCGSWWRASCRSTTTSCMSCRSADADKCSTWHMHLSARWSCSQYSSDDHGTVQHVANYVMLSNVCRMPSTCCPT